MSIESDLKIRNSSQYDPRVSRLCSSSGNFCGSEIRHGTLWGLNFGPGILLGFVLSARDFLGVLIFAPIRSSVSLEN